jgi:hypothetical protein
VSNRQEIPGASSVETVCAVLLKGTLKVQIGTKMRDLLAGITPIAAGFALAVIIHRSERTRQAA